VTTSCVEASLNVGLFAQLWLQSMIGRFACKYFRSTNVFDQLYLIRNDGKTSVLLADMCKKVGNEYTEFLRKLGAEEHIVSEYLEQPEKTLHKKLTVLQNSTKDRSLSCLI